MGACRTVSGSQADDRKYGRRAACRAMLGSLGLAGLLVGTGCPTEAECFEQRSELLVDIRDHGVPVVSSAGSVRFAPNAAEIAFTCPEAERVNIRYSCEGGALVLYYLPDADFALRLREPRTWTTTVAFPRDDVLCGKVEPVVVVPIGE